MNWTKEEMKQYFLFLKDSKVILKNKEKDISLIADLDYFNGNISYHIEAFDLEYEHTKNISDAIESYYNFLEKQEI